MRALGSGMSVGQTVRELRWELLVRGNVMGLAYSPYCDADLRIPLSDGGEVSIADLDARVGHESSTG